MKKIDRNGFISDFFRKSKIIPEDSNILQLNHAFVHEKFNNGKYQYSVDDSDSKEIQKRILNKFLERIEINNAAVAFRKNYSYFNFLQPHKDGYYFLRLDVSSFFHSISFSTLSEVFSNYFEDITIEDASNFSLLDVFLSYITYLVPESSQNKDFRGKTILPMGFLTSPTISNIIFRSIDIHIQKFCQFHNIRYTRYADDLLFSSGINSSFLHSDLFEREISVLLSLLGLKLNNKKTLRKTHTISLNGYIIQNSSKLPFFIYKSGFIHVSNKKTEIIEKIIHKINVEKKSHLIIMKKLYGFHMKSKFSENTIKFKTLERYASNQLFNKIVGYRSFLISILHFENKFNCISLEALKKYRHYIDNLNQILDRWPL